MWSKKDTKGFCGYARRASSQHRSKITSIRSSEEEHKADALALEAEEGRDKLRKAAGRSKYPTIRRYPNGETHLR